MDLSPGDRVEVWKRGRWSRAVVVSVPAPGLVAVRYDGELPFPAETVPDYRVRALSPPPVPAR